MASTHRLTHDKSASLEASKYGEDAAIAMIHVARMKKGHNFDLMSGERRGNTTAPKTPQLQIGLLLSEPGSEQTQYLRRLIRRHAVYTKPDQQDH